MSLFYSAIVLIVKTTRWSFFSGKCKPSDKASMILFKNDLQRTFQNDGNRLISNGYSDDNDELTLRCFGCRIRSNSSKSINADSNSSSPKPCFCPNIKGIPFVLKKQSEKSHARTSIALSSNQHSRLLLRVLSVPKKDAASRSLCMSTLRMTDSI